MAQNEILIRSALLTTNEKLPDRFLFSGKIEAENCENSFLFYLFEIATPWSSSCVKIKKNILEIIDKRFHPENITEEETIFEKILQEINQALNSLAQKGENSWIGNLNSIIGLVNENGVCIAQAGKFSGYIFRKGKISSLTENSHLKEEPHPLKTFSDITQGRLFPEDRIVFGNIELYNHFSLDRIRKTVEQLSANESLQEFYHVLKRNKIMSVNAIIIEAKSIHKLPDEKKVDLPEVITLDQQEEGLAKVMAKKYSPVLKKYFEKTKNTLSKAHKLVSDNIKNRKNKPANSKRVDSALKNGFFHKGLRAINSGANAIGKTVAPALNKIQSSEKYQKIKVKTFPYAGKTASGTSKMFKNLSSFLLPAFKFIFLKKNRKYLYGCLILLLIFIGYLKIRANNSGRAEKNREQQIALSYDKAKEAFNKANEDIALKKTGDTKGLEDALALALESEKSPANKDKATELAKQIQTALDKQTQTTRLFDPKPTISYAGTIGKIVMAGLDIYGFGSDGKIYVANTADKEPRLVASIGKENGDIAAAAFSASKDKIFIYSKNDKMISYDITSKTQGELKITDGSGKWEDAKAIAAFVTNIYLLDSEAGEVWKHVESDTGYAKGTTYATANKVTLRGAVDLAVDGNIYILLNDGGVAKFVKGTYDPAFALKSIPGGNGKIEIPAKIYTDSDTNYIFILDKKINRIIRFDKAGNFINQYSIDGMTIDDFVVNGKVQKLWMLAGSKIFEIDL